MDLIGGLDALERHELRHDSRRFVDTELLTFFRSIHERNRSEERLVMLVESSSPELSVPLARWLSRHPRIAVKTCPGTDAWKRSLIELVQRRSPPGPTGSAPEGLRSFLDAVGEWKREREAAHGPFAWFRDAFASEH
jgi:hypothetical protein